MLLHSFIVLNCVEIVAYNIHVKIHRGLQGGSRQVPCWVWYRAMLWVVNTGQQNQSAWISTQWRHTVRNCTCQWPLPGTAWQWQAAVLPLTGRLLLCLFCVLCRQSFFRWHSNDCYVSELQGEPI